MGRRREREIKAQVHAALAEFAAAIEVRLHAELDRSQRTQLALVEALRSMHGQLQERDSSIVQALDRIGDFVERATERLEADRAERRALVDGLESLARAAGALPEPSRGAPPRERVVGGTIFGGPPDIDLVGVGSDNGGGAIEVECRFGDRWVNGFEIYDIVRESDELRFRVRRLSDASVLPKLFDASEVRRVVSRSRSESQSTTADGAPTSGWHSPGR